MQHAVTHTRIIPGTVADTIRPAVFERIRHLRQLGVLHGRAGAGE